MQKVFALSSIMMIIFLLAACSKEEVKFEEMPIMTSVKSTNNVAATQKAASYIGEVEYVSGSSYNFCNLNMAVTPGRYGHDYQCVNIAVSVDFQISDPNYCLLFIETQVPGELAARVLAEGTFPGGGMSSQNNQEADDIIDGKTMYYEACFPRYSHSYNGQLFCGVDTQSQYRKDGCVITIWPEGTPGP